METGAIWEVSRPLTTGVRQETCSGGVLGGDKKACEKQGAENRERVKPLRPLGVKSDPGPVSLLSQGKTKTDAST